MNIKVGDYVHVRFLNREFRGEITLISPGYDDEDHGTVEILVDEECTEKGCEKVTPYFEHFVYHGFTRMLVKHIESKE